jgi:hypothetical protein
MKIIFLDIDGVLALAGDPSKRLNIREGLTTPYLWNVEACEIFTQLLNDTMAKIVLSSDWRKHFSLSDMREILFVNKIPYDNLIGYTPYSKKYNHSTTRQELGLYRSDEINMWVALHGLSSKEWVAIDDLPLSGIPKENFVRCVDADKGILG